MTTLTVTATQGGGTFAGMILRVKVLTGAAAAASQTGNTVVTSAAYNASITTTVTGSVVYGAITAGSGGFTAEPLCTLIDNYNDSTNLEQYGSFRTTSATGTPGATLVGASAPAYSIGGMAAAEILPSGTIAEDVSAPAVVTSNTLTALTSASFTPPSGSLIVVLIGSDGDGVSTTTMTVTDTGGGLTWTPLAQANASNQEYAGVWIAQVPSAAAAVPAPPVLLNPLPPGWFPGADRAAAVPGGIPFAPLPGTTDATPATIQFLPAPQAAPYQGPLLPPGWVPGLAAVTQDPGGIPFYSEPQPENAPPAVPALPAAPGIPDYLPYPPFWFPGGDKLSGAPGGIPFWVQPQPDSSPALPSPPAVPVITGASADGTYFTDQNGNPRLLVGEDIWDVIINGGRWNGNFNADIGAYTASRAAQGYTAAEVEMFSTNVPNSTYVFNDGRDWDGTWPFAGSTDPTTTPNPAFWARRDYFLSSCAANGITVVFSASTAGLSVAGNWILGWSTAQWQAYGTFLANRYKDTPNILWITGDDYFGEKDTQLSAWLAALRAGGDTHLVAIQGFQETTSRFAYNPTHAADPLSFCVNSQYDWVYTYNPSYNGITYAQQFEPSASDVVQQQVPPVWGDGFYLASGTGAGQTDVRLERQNIWWALSSGAAGISTGDNEVYPWLSTAAGLVTSKTFYSAVIPAITGAFQSLPGWQKLVSDWNSALVTAGRGTRSADTATGSNGYIDNTDNYVSASRAPDGSLAVIYCAQAFSITIDQAQMAPGYTVTWIDPVNGTASPGTPGSTYNSGTAKGSNSAGDPDWVLVLQGTPAPAPAPGLPDWQPLPPGWFPGADKVTDLPGGIPFYVIPQPADQNAPAGAPAVTAPAGTPAGTGTAQPPLAAIGANTAAGTGAGAAQQPVTAAGANAAAASGTGTAGAPVPAAAVNAGLATGTGAALDAGVATVPATTAPAGLASGTGTAQQPLTATGANAGVATGTGAGQSPAAAIAVTDVLASGTGTAPAPLATLGANAAAAAGTGTAQAPAAAVAVNAGVATGTGTAQPVSTAALPVPGPGYPAVLLGPGWFPGADTLAGAPGGIPFWAQPTPAIPGFVTAAPAAAPAGTAAGAGIAQPPLAAVAPAAGLAAGTGTAWSPVPAVTADAGLASGSGTAPMVIASVTVTAGLAPSSGTAPQPAAVVQVTAVLAPAAGSAPRPGIAITVTAGLAAATGAALNPVPPVPPVAIVFSYGTPYSEWEYGDPGFEWEYGTPYSGWAAGDPYLS